MCEMKPQGSHVAPNHITSKRKSWDSNCEVSRVGASDLCKPYYRPALEVVSAICAPRDLHTICTSNPDLVPFPLASTIVSCPTAQPLALSAQLPVLCETFYQCLPTSELLSGDSELPHGAGRQLCEIFLDLMHQNCPSVTAFPVFRVSCQNMAQRCLGGSVG